MDQNNKDNYLNKHEEKSLDKLQSRVVFNNPAYLFIFKKTEKIVAAIYLITNLLSDTEPLKTQIREITLKTISSVVAFKRAPTSQLKHSIVDLASFVSELISLIKIATISDHISTMNGGIVQHELTALLEHIEKLNLEVVGDGLILPQDFFTVPEPSFGARGFSTVRPFAFTSNSMEQSHKGQYRTATPIKDNKPEQTPKIDIKDNRRDAMLRLLKDGKQLSIKDFVKEIKDCSEKTIQRELLALVEKGVLKKTGERRWSVYSLA